MRRSYGPTALGKTLSAVALALVAALVAGGTTDRAAAAPTVKQPPQPKTGLGGSDYANRGVRVSSTIRAS